MKVLTHAERNQLAKNAIELIIKLFPPDDLVVEGENSDVEELYNTVVSLGELSEDQIEEIMECGSGTV